MKRSMTGPVVVSLLLHALLILAFVLKWNLDKPKRPGGGGGGGGVVHAVVIDQLQFKQHAEFVKQQKQQKLEEQQERIQEQKKEVEARAAKIDKLDV